MTFAQEKALTCKSLADKTKTKGYIITVLEEPIGTAQKNASDLNILDCVKKLSKCESNNGDSCNTFDEPGTCGDSGKCYPVQAIYSTSGPELLYTYVGLIYRWAALTIGIVSVFFMVWAGIRMSASGGDSSSIDEDKTRIIQSISGLVLLFLTGLILYTINPNFFVQ